MELLESSRAGIVLTLNLTFALLDTALCHSKLIFTQIQIFDVCFCILATFPCFNTFYTNPFLLFSKSHYLSW